MIPVIVVCPDRIEAGTYLVAAAITGGSITVNGIEPDSMRSVIGKLIETGADIQTNKNSIKLNMKRKASTSSKYTYECLSKFSDRHASAIYGT